DRARTDRQRAQRARDRALGPGLLLRRALGADGRGAELPGHQASRAARGQPQCRAHVRPGRLRLCGGRWAGVGAHVDPSHADPSTARAPSVARDADHAPPDLSADHERRPERAGARGMTVRRRGLMALLGLLAIATIVTAVVLAGGPPENEGPGTSAFDPSVPTSTHTPPPASGTAAPRSEERRVGSEGRS